MSRRLRMIRDNDEYERVAALVAGWEREIKAMSYEERKALRDSGEPPFDTYWKAVEAMVAYEW